MSDLTDVKFFLASLLRPIVREAINAALAESLLSVQSNDSYEEPFGDFNWLQKTCSGIPTSTLRIKSAAGEIPGTKKVGKRVLYEKVEVINWLRGQAQQGKLSSNELSQNAQEQTVSGSIKKVGLGKRIVGQSINGKGL
jgi:hypothetical protein